MPACLLHGRLHTAAGLLGAEASHAGAVRALLSPLALQDAGLGNGKSVAEAADAFTLLFNKLAGGAVSDVGLKVPPAQAVTGAASPGMGDALQLSSVDHERGLAFSRSPAQVLGIEFGTGDETRPGLFFPRGFNSLA